MRAGDLDRRILIQRRSRSQSVTGEEVETWLDVQRLWAGKRDMRANERWASDQNVSEIETVWTARWWPAWEMIRADTHRLVYRDRVYEIHGLREIGRRDGVEIATSARAEGRYG